MVTYAILGIAALGVAAQILWLSRMVRHGLAPRYRALAALLGISALLEGVSLILFYLVLNNPRNPDLSRSYFWFYVASRPIIWGLFFAVIYDSYARLVKAYPAVRRAGRLITYGAVGSVVATGVFLAASNPSQVGDPRFWRGMTSLNEQSVYLGAAIAFVLVLGLQKFYGLPLSRNAALIVGVFGIYFVGCSLLHVGIGHSGKETALFNLVGVSLYVACLSYGCLRFSPRGEAIAQDARFALPNAQGASTQAAAQLDELNLQLMRVFAK